MLRRHVWVAVAAPAAASASVAVACGQYCSQAGTSGFELGTPVVRILTTATPLLPNGTLLVKVQCLVSVPCTGALLLQQWGMSQQVEFKGELFGAADMNVPASSTAEVPVAPTPVELARLRALGTSGLMVIADAGLVPPCSQIPSPPITCPTTAAPGQFDGLIRRVSAIVAVIAG